MSRRRLEAAIQAGLAIELSGRIIPETPPEKFTRVESDQTIESREETDGIFSLQYSYDGTRLMVGTGNEAIRIYDTTNGRHIGDLRKPHYGGYAITALRFHPYQHHVMFAASSEGVVFSCDTREGQYKCDNVLTERKNHLYCLDFSEDGERFATAGKDLAVRIYDTKTLQLITAYEGYKVEKPQEDDAQGHGMRVFALKHHPENAHILLTGGWDNHVKVWDTRSTDGVKRTIPGPHICGDALDVRGFRVLTGSWTAKNSLQIWDYSSGKLVKNIPCPDAGNGEYLYTAQFADNGAVLAGGSGTNSVHAIDSESGELLGTVEMGKCIQSLDSTKGGMMFAVGAQGRHVKTACLC